MRVVSGKYRNRKLVAPEGMTTRPTMDMVKEAMFNILGHKVYDAMVLDLFSGSGALGIEAISRGAKMVVFNDADTKAYRTILHNIECLRITESHLVSNLDYLRCLETIKDKLDIVLLDPPYKEKIYAEILNILESRALLNPHAIVVIESDLDYTYIPVDGYDNKEYKYGSKKLLVLRRRS